MGLSQQEYWTGLTFLPPGDLYDPWIKPASPVSSALVGGFFTTEPHGNPISIPHFFFLVFMSFLVVAVSQTCLVDDLGNFEGGSLGINQ